MTSKRIPTAALLLLIFVVGLITTGTGAISAEANAPTTLYLPLIHTDPSEASVPQISGTILLPDAECPNDIAVNASTGYVYVTNEESDNISILANNEFLVNVNTGNWPIWLATHPTTSRVYGTHVLGTITAFDKAQVTQQIQGYHEPYNMVINTTNDLFYVSDLHSRITILQDDEIITHLPLINTQNGKPIEWNLAADFDPTTGLTYFASWVDGRLSILDGTSMVDQFSYGGQGGKDMVIDPERRRMTIANFRAGEDGGAQQNVTVVNLDTHAVTSIQTSQKSRHLALEPTTGLVYATDPYDDTVTVVSGIKVLTVQETGEKPWGVYADPRTGYVFVANSGDNTVSVLKKGLVVDTITLSAGYEPRAFAQNQATGDIYVLSRSSRTRYDDNYLPKLVCEQPAVTVLSYD